MLENNLFKQYFSNVLYPLSLIGSFISQFLKSPQQSKVAAIVVKDDNTHLKSTDSPTSTHVILRVTLPYHQYFAETFLSDWYFSDPSRILLHHL